MVVSMCPVNDFALSLVIVLHTGLLVFYHSRGGRSPREMDRPSYGRGGGDSYSNMDSDPYYGSFSDTPGPQSRDYRHGLGGKSLVNGSNELRVTGRPCDSGYSCRLDRLSEVGKCFTSWIRGQPILSLAL